MKALIALALSLLIISVCSLMAADVDTTPTLERMQQVMGKFPPAARRCALDVKLLEETDCGTYVRRLVSYQSEPGSTTPAYLLIPKTAVDGTSASLTGILSLHSTNQKIGQKVVVGLGDLPNRDNARELALRGHVVIAPAYPLMAGYNPDLHLLGYASGTMKAIWDNSRALDLLDSLPYVRHGNYGAIGHSLGGHNALFTAAFDPRIKAAICSSGFDSFTDYKNGDLSGWAQPLYMPEIARYKSAGQIPFDFDDVLAAIAPRAIFVNAPLHDDNFNWRSVDRMIESARHKAQARGQNWPVTAEHPDCDHDFPPDVRQRAYRFLETHLHAPASP